MAIKNLVRYYSQENVNLVMLKRHKYICINNYDESFNDFLEKPQIKQVLNSIARQEGIEIRFKDNRSNRHLKQPNAVILDHQGYTFIHPHLANLFFPSVYPLVAYHVYRFYEQKTYYHSDSPRKELYLPLEEGHRDWMKTFVDELYDAFYRFLGIENKGKSYQHPLYFGHLTNRYIYDQLPVFGSDEVKAELKELREVDDTKTFVVKLHQYLEDEGRDLLIRTIHRIIDYMDVACDKYHDIKERKQWLNDFLKDKKTGQTRLALHTYSTERKGA